METSKKKIEEYKKKIKEEKEKLKKSKKRRNRKKFKETKVGRFFKKITSIFDNKKDSYSFSEVFVITLLSLVIGAFACFSVFTVFTGGRNYFKLSKELNKFFDAYDAIVENYYGEIDKNKLVEEAISGMVSSVGDEYTSYSNSESTNTFDELVSGVYEGIGCTIQQLEKSIKVIEVFEDGPADEAGLKPGDLIIKVDDLDAVSEGVTKISSYIKEESQGEVTMVILRDEKEITLKLERATVETPNVTSKIIEKNDKKIGYINISVFSAIAGEQFKKKLEKLEKDEIVGLVIDVRGNNGGYLSTVTSISSMLLPKGKNIYQVQKDEKITITKDKTAEKREYPIAVLVNGNSASASEILAAVVKESYGGYVVGVKTYGKGTVQQVKKLTDGSMIKYTIENWLSPDGNWIDDTGVIPTHEVEMELKYYKDSTSENDNQLQKALDLVSK